MILKIHPEINKALLIDKNTMLHILQGTGGIEVDFKSYHDWQDKLIFLEKGQYIKFLSDDFVVRKIEFEDASQFINKDVRVLFKHLVALGYIDFQECSECQKYLDSSIFSENNTDIIDVSSEQWFWQNPFQASKEEYHIIFDIKDIIDEKYKNHLSNHELAKIIGSRGYDSQALFKDKVGLTVKNLISEKRFLESKKEVAFSNKSIKEIAYEFGFKDPAYFNRIFSKLSGESPNKFRASINFNPEDDFLPELYRLLKTHHKENRSTEFYAKQMKIPVKSLSKKVKNKLNVTIGQLIRQEIINTAKAFLHSDLNIKAIAIELGFQEANHFSSFFKHHTNVSPSEYRIRISGD